MRFYIYKKKKKKLCIIRKRFQGERKLARRPAWSVARWFVNRSKRELILRGARREESVLLSMCAKLGRRFHDRLKPFRSWRRRRRRRRAQWARELSIIILECGMWHTCTPGELVSNCSGAPSWVTRKREIINDIEDFCPRHRTFSNKFVASACCQIDSSISQFFFNLLKILLPSYLCIFTFLSHLQVFPFSFLNFLQRKKKRDKKIC